MTATQGLYGLAILVLFGLRPFAYRPCAKLFSPQTASAFTGLWLTLGGVFMLPFFGHMLTAPELTQTSWAIALGASALKGFLLWYMIKFMQLVNKESLSSSVFFGPVGLGIGTLVNTFVLGENLSTPQLVSVLGLALLGLVFFLYGHAKNLSRTGKLSFAFLVGCVVVFMAVDHTVISRTNWYVHYLTSSSVFLLASFANRITAEEWKTCITKKQTVVAGLVYVAGEAFALSVMVTILPVPLVNLSVRLAVPVVMVLSAFIYGEGKWQEQALFGALAYLLVLPLVFG